jgi:hypothetical protein
MLLGNATLKEISEKEDPQFWGEGHRGSAPFPKKWVVVFKKSLKF